MMSDLELWSVVIGTVLPGLVAVVNRLAWAGWVKGLVALGSSLLMAVGTAWLHGVLTQTSFTAGTWVHSALFVTVSTFGAYRLLWHPTGWAQAIEQATEPGPAPIVAGSHAAPMPSVWMTTENIGEARREEAQP